MIHELKILPEYFSAVKSGAKNFEIRRNDRNFQVGDTLILKEYYRGRYTGNQVERGIGYIYHGDGTFGLQEGFCVLALNGNVIAEGEKQ